MPVAGYEICADEAWTHWTPPLNRYWCFFGGVFGPEADCNRLETALRAAAQAERLSGEIKWSSVTGHNLVGYKRLVDVFFHHIARHSLTYRQVFLDRSYVHVPSPLDPGLTPLDVQFRICYQFLKHHFGLRYLPATDPAREHHVTIRLDNHSSQHHTRELQTFAGSLGRTLDCPSLRTQVTFVNSKQFLRLQLCDLLMGAAGSHGNKMHLRRRGGRRGMTAKQRWRLEMAQYIYNHLRALDAAERNTRAFNWFESTGHDGAFENRLRHKIRIWKFIPHRYQKDAGWENDQLDRQGCYQRQLLLPQIHDRSNPFPGEP